MRAVVMSGPSRTSDRTDVQEIDEPRPGPGEITVAVGHAGINFVDVMHRRGDPGYVTSWPYVPGFEVAGTVLRTGTGVTGLEPGQPVVGLTRHGGLAEVATVAAELVVPVPDEVAPGVAAAVPGALTTALLLLTDAARIGPGERLLVHSASGGVGAAVARIAPLLGAGPLIGTVGDPGKTGAARAAGYQTALARGDGFAEAVRVAAPGGVDVVLDPLGTRYLDVDLDVAAPGARIVLFGNASGAAPGPLPPFGRLLQGNVLIGGFSIGSLSATAPGRVASGIRRVLELLASGRLRFDVTEISLDEVPGIHDALAEGRGVGKYVARL